jgi:hypothetical protein
VVDVETPSESFDILMRWKVISAKFLVLSKIAQDALPILITIVASQSTFSTGSRMIDPFQSSLVPKPVEALICT